MTTSNHWESAIRELRAKRFSCFEPLIDFDSLYPRPQMRREEVEALDVLMQIIRPDVVVEIGTGTGASARFFARFPVRVVTLDPKPEQVEPFLFAGSSIEQICGKSPDALDQVVAEVLRGAERVSEDPVCIVKPRVLAFLDGDHDGDLLFEEVRWALGELRAVAAVWHDAHLAPRARTDTAAKRRSLIYTLSNLRAAGVPAHALQCFGRDVAYQDDYLAYSGLGIAWPK